MSVFKKFFSKASGAEEEKVPEPLEFDNEGENLCHLNEIQLLSAHKDIVRVLLKIDDSRFASAGDDSSIIIWDSKTGKKKMTLTDHTLPITCLLLRPNSDRNEPPVLISGSSDRTIRMWDLETGECFQTLKVHQGSVKCLTAPENQMFCSGGNDNMICLWSKEGKLQGKIERKDGDHLHCLLVIRNNRLVAASDSTLLVYNLQTLTEHKSLSAPNVRAHREAVRCLCHVSDGLFASASLDGAIILWTTHTLTPLRTLNVQLSYQDQEFHVFPYSVQHMVSLGERYLLAAIGCGFSLFDVLTGDCLLKCPKAHHSSVQHIMTLYNNERIVTCSADSSIRIWAPETITFNNKDLSPLPQRSPLKQEHSSLSGLELFFKQTRASSVTVKPVCLGELIAHADSVNSMLILNEYSFVSCGSDWNLVLWKDGLVETQKRNEIAQKYVSMFDPFDSFFDDPNTTAAPPGDD